MRDIADFVTARLHSPPRCALVVVHPSIEGQWCVSGRDVSTNSIRPVIDVISLEGSAGGTWHVLIFGRTGFHLEGLGGVVLPEQVRVVGLDI